MTTYWIDAGQPTSTCQSTYHVMRSWQPYKKQIKINNETQFLINSMLKDEIEKNKIKKEQKKS